MMDRVTVDLTNCYGIKRLLQCFDFSQESVYAIYAPNGVMKSSLAQVFRDLAGGATSQDRIFPTRASTRTILDENGSDLRGESVLVVRPYDEEFHHTEKTSTLLVDAKLRKEYEELHVTIDKSKEVLLQTLKRQSHSKRDLEKEISSAFTSSDDEFFTALTRIEKEVTQQKDTPFADVEYDTLFDDRVLGFLEGKDVKTAIEGYVKRYNELLEASTYFKKGTFDYYNAAQIAKTLASNGFFEAKHTVHLNADTPLEIKTQKELEDVIEREKQELIKDKALRKKFDDLEKLITKNTTLREFQQYVLNHEALISQLTNIDKFKEDVWKSYLKANIDSYIDLITKYHAAEIRKRQIEVEAAKQRTQWENVIDIFNSRFIVPFKLLAKNRTAVMLGYQPMISLEFTYHDGEDQVSIDRAALLKALSTGERKALYILNVIFEVEVRRKAKQETMMVIDDLADSFDYQNKYAIIQYLQDINDDRLFKQVIMTHNFDFFRTINSRFVSYPHCLMATKSHTGIILEQASGIKNVFANDWQCHFSTDPKKKVACIPFLRNLVEYTKGEADSKFVKLTSLLHWKQDTTRITESELNDIYNEVCGSSCTTDNGTRPVIDIIRTEARECMTTGSRANLENKVVLAIGIRLAAEEFMVRNINDDTFVAGIHANQTQALVKKFKELFVQHPATQILDRVLLMTPENIHLNSFMYEPIVDMSDEHLRRLYSAVIALA
jgi:hypothetical protein